MKDQDRLRSLQQIHDSAQKMRAFVARKQSVPSHLLSVPKTRCKIHIMPLRFPSIEDITRILLDSGISEHVLQRSSDTVIKAIISLQETHSRSYEQIALHILDLPPVSTSTTPQEMLEKWRVTNESLFTKQLLPAISTKLKAVNDAYLYSSQHKPCDGKKLPFNNEYTPLLEKYFEYNAYPSAPDRKVLAQKSFMTQRQIEVWFQNHRNRAKKEGRPLRRYQHDNLPENISIISSCDHVTSKSETLSFEGDKVGEFPEKYFIPESSKPVAITLHDPAPSYTFPTPYKSRYPQNPLIMQSQDIKKLYKFSSPEWGRKPATSLAPVLVMEFDDLASSFTSKLNLRRRTSKEQSTQKSPFDTNNNSWFSHRVTTPSPAPHPALIRTQQIQPFVQPTLSTLSGWLIGLSHKPTKDSTQPVDLPQKGRDIRRKNQLYSCKASLGGLGRKSGYPTSTVIPGSRTSSCSSTGSTDSLGLSSPSSSTSSLSTPSTSPTTSPISLPEANFILQDQLLDELFGHYPQELTFLDREPTYKNYSPHNPLKIPSLIVV